MSCLLLRRLPARSLLSAPRQLPPISSAFHTSPALSALSESDHAQDTPARDTKIEHHKSDSVQKGQEGKGEWKPELASNSEQAVKAEKHDKSMKEMQELGKKKGEAEK